MWGQVKCAVQQIQVAAYSQTQLARCVVFHTPHQFGLGDWHYNLPSVPKLSFIEWMVMHQSHSALIQVCLLPFCRRVVVTMQGET